MSTHPTINLSEDRTESPVDHQSTNLGRASAVPGALMRRAEAFPLAQGVALPAEMQTTLQNWLQAEMKAGALEHELELDDDESVLRRAYDDYCNRIEAGESVDVNSFCAQHS